MEKRTWLEIRVGIFVCIGLFLSMLVVFLLGGKTSIFQSTYSIYAKFDNVSGLSIGALVSLAGINVGEVEEMTFPANIEDKQTIVRMKINHSFQDRIRKDSKASISTQGLLGDKYIYITMGSSQNSPLKDGDMMATDRGLSIESFADSGQKILDQANESLKKMNELLNDIQNKEGMIHALIYDLEGKDFVKDIMAFTRAGKQILQEVQKGRGIAHALIYDKTDPQMIQEISRTLKNMEKTSQNVHEMTAKIEKGEGTLGGLLNDPTVYSDLKSLLGKANRSKLIQAVIRHTLSQNEKDTLK